jgi:hypothetical protein
MLHRNVSRFTATNALHRNEDAAPQRQIFTATDGLRRKRGRFTASQTLHRNGNASPQRHTA